MIFGLSMFFLDSDFAIQYLDYQQLECLYSAIGKSVKAISLLYVHPQITRKKNTNNKEYFFIDFESNLNIDFFI